MMRLTISRLDDAATDLLRSDPVTSFHARTRARFIFRAAVGHAAEIPALFFIDFRRRVVPSNISGSL